MCGNYRSCRMFNSIRFQFSNREVLNFGHYHQFYAPLESNLSFDIRTCSSFDPHTKNWVILSKCIETDSACPYQTSFIWNTAFSKLFIFWCPLTWSNENIIYNFLMTEIKTFYWRQWLEYNCLETCYKIIRPVPSEHMKMNVVSCCMTSDWAFYSSENGSRPTL